MYTRPLPCGDIFVCNQNLFIYLVVFSAREFASTCIEEQKKGFMKWGVMGDWSNYYNTHSKQFVAKELAIFTHLFEKGYIFQVIWTFVSDCS